MIVKVLFLSGQAEGVLGEFKEWFENPNFKKVWHNYGFDRHVLANMVRPLP